jgi:hypothetical protein
LLQDFGVCLVNLEQNFNVSSLSKINALIATTIDDANIFPILHHGLLFPYHMITMTQMMNILYSYKGNNSRRVHQIDVGYEHGLCLL